MLKVEDLLAAAASLVDRELDSLLPTEAAEPARLHAAIRWSVFGGGKRFRPALLLAVGRTFGAPDKQLARTAAAVEMIHTYSLIHDDLPSMDDDDLRRGRETAHRKFDEATAILAGDALQSLAFRTIAGDDSLPSAIRLKLLGSLADAGFRMVQGQQSDIDAEGKPLAVDEIREIHALKTGALIAFSASAGATIAEASPEDEALVEKFGVRLGLLFQIADDVLDVTQSSAVLGKTAAKDAAAEKASYPSILGVDGSRKMLAEVYESTLETLKMIGRPTDLLAELAEYVMNRES